MFFCFVLQTVEIAVCFSIQYWVKIHFKFAFWRTVENLVVTTLYKYIYETYMHVLSPIYIKEQMGVPPTAPTIW